MNSILTITLNTYRESIRSKIMYSLLFFAAVLVLVAASFGTVTLGDQVKVIKDMGLFSISLFPVAYVSIAGAALLHKELSRKTIHNILSKPVSRWEFLIGKYFGMLVTVMVMVSLLGFALLLFCALFEGRIDFLLIDAFVSIFCQLVIICACAMFFSSMVVTPVLSGAFTFGIYLAGRSTEYLLYFVRQGQLEEGIGKFVLQSLYYLVPHLDAIDVSNQVVYGISPNPQSLVWSALYAAGYAGVMLIIASAVFARREFN